MTEGMQIRMRNISVTEITNNIKGVKAELTFTSKTENPDEEEPAESDINNKKSPENN